MFRIDGPDAVAVMPEKGGAAGEPGYFDGGNPATGQPATMVTAGWLNTVQEEILSVIVGAGIAPDRGKNDQLFLAIQGLVEAGVINPGENDTWLHTDKDGNIGWAELAGIAIASTTERGIARIATAEEIAARTTTGEGPAFVNPENFPKVQPPQMINTRTIITTTPSPGGIWVVPVTGWYKVTIVGGGGCGGNGSGSGKGGLSGTRGGTTTFNAVSAVGGHSGGGGGNAGGGGGGAAGDVKIVYLHLEKDQSINVTIGAGGIVPSSGFTSSLIGQNGSGGAKGGAKSTGGQGGKNAGSGGSETYHGGAGIYSNPSTNFGASNVTEYGGGGGGGLTLYIRYTPTYAAPGGTNGQNGATMYQQSVTYCKGGNGGPGAVILEYHTPQAP